MEASYNPRPVPAHTFTHLCDTAHHVLSPPWIDSHPRELIPADQQAPFSHSDSHIKPAKVAAHRTRFRRPHELEFRICARHRPPRGKSLLVRLVGDDKWLTTAMGSCVSAVRLWGSSAPPVRSSPMGRVRGVTQAASRARNQ